MTKKYIVSTIIGLMIILGFSAQPIIAGNQGANNLQVNNSQIESNYKSGQIIDGIKIYSGKDYSKFIKEEEGNLSIMGDSEAGKALLAKTLPNIVSGIEGLDIPGQNIIKEGNLVICDNTLSLVLPLEVNSVLDGKQRLELYQYQLSALLRAVEVGITQGSAAFSDVDKELLAHYQNNLSVTYFNAKSNTLVFYPNGVFVLDEVLIEKANRIQMEGKLGEFFEGKF